MAGDGSSTRPPHASPPNEGGVTSDRQQPRPWLDAMVAKGVKELKEAKEAKEAKEGSKTEPLQVGADARAERVAEAAPKEEVTQGQGLRVERTLGMAAACLPPSKRPRHDSPSATETAAAEAATEAVKAAEAAEKAEKAEKVEKVATRRNGLESS